MRLSVKEKRSRGGKREREIHPANGRSKSSFLGKKKKKMLVKGNVWICWFAALAAFSSIAVRGFSPPAAATTTRWTRPLQPRRSPSTATTTTTTTALDMCICIDCARVTNCAAYHFVETKHEQPHMNENPTFEPVDGRCVKEKGRRAETINYC
eukprot:scaffold4957_cov152-Amphora_coffeaeformis.AAC.1